jgi:hypothetical protein
MTVPDRTSSGRLSVRKLPVIPALAGFYFDFTLRCHKHSGMFLADISAAVGVVARLDKKYTCFDPLQAVAMHVHVVCSASHNTASGMYSHSRFEHPHNRNGHAVVNPQGLVDKTFT